MTLTAPQPAHERALSALPPTLLVILAITAIQVGAAMAVFLFPVLGPEGTVALRIALSALLLLLATRRQVPALPRLLRAHWRTLVPFGVCCAAMNLCFYLAIDRIPLGAAVALEFIGPLGVAAFNSRRPSQLGWVALAAIGIALLSPFSGVELDPVGIGYALLAGAGWASFIVLAKRVSAALPGNDGLTIGMCIAAAIMLPLAVPVLPKLIDPTLALMALGVALLSTTIPFTFEFQALKRLPPRTYGVLVSLEPGVATLVGALLLGERIGIQGTAAVLCVVIAAIGMTRSGGTDET
ncbi:MAG: EamA family transporter [Pseudomonadota bacterium]